MRRSCSGGVGGGDGDMVRGGRQVTFVGVVVVVVVVVKGNGLGADGTIEPVSNVAVLVLIPTLPVSVIPKLTLVLEDSGDTTRASPFPVSPNLSGIACGFPKLC